MTVFSCGRAKAILGTEGTLSEVVQLVGRDSLTEDQKLLMDVAKVIREDFLQQNSFSDHDFNCPLPKSVGETCFVQCFEAPCSPTFVSAPARHAALHRAAV